MTTAREVVDGVDLMGKTCVITGASAGIGQAFCRLLASQGYDIIAVARRSERLASLARELNSAHAIEVLPLELVPSPLVVSSSPPPEQASPFPS